MTDHARLGDPCGGDPLGAVVRVAGRTTRKIAGQGSRAVGSVVEGLPDQNVTLPTDVGDLGHAGRQRRMRSVTIHAGRCGEIVALVECGPVRARPKPRDLVGR